MASQSAALPVAELPPLSRNRRFLMILIGYAVSQLGDNFHTLALSIWVLQKTGSATAMSAISGARILAAIFLGAIGGTVADRVDRWRLMWMLDLLRGGIVAAIAWSISLQTTPFWVILALSTSLSVVSQFRSPAFSASLRQIVGTAHLGQAQSLIQLTGTGAGIVGPLLGGTVVAAFGGWAAMTGDATSFFVSAACVLLGGAFASPRAQKAAAAKRSFWRDLADGFAYIRRDPFILGIIILAPCINFFGNAIGVLLPALVVNVWRLEPTQFGLLEAAGPVGMAITGAIMMARADKLKRRGWWMMGTIFLLGPVISGLGLAPNVWVACAMVGATGVLTTITNLVLSVSLQTKVAPEVQGRVFGTLTSLMQVASPLSIMMAGPLADHFGPVAVTVATGVLLMVVNGVLTVAIPAVRNYD